VGALECACAEEGLSRVDAMERGRDGPTYMGQRWALHGSKQDNVYMITHEEKDARDTEGGNRSPFHALSSLVLWMLSIVMCLWIVVDCGLL